jgi:autoinducer 2 (AI-2) kinase
MKILVTATLEESGLAQLRRNGEVLYEPMRDTQTILAGEEMIEKLRGVQVLITEADMVSADVLQKALSLKVVVSCRGWAVNIDVPAATANGVLVLNTPGRNADAVADLAVCMMIMLGRRVPQLMRLMADPDVAENPMLLLMQVYFGLQGTELWDKTVGLIGFGAVAQKVAARLAGFETHLVAYDPYVSADVFDGLNVRSVDLTTLLRESDYVSLHAKVTPETTGMIGASEFALMKPTAYFLNLARAAMTDEDALLRVLQEKQIAGAALDVFMQEPPAPDNPLLKLDNVLALPHIGGNTAEVAVHQTRILVPDIERLVRGERPLNMLNPEVWAGFRLEAPRRPAND